MKRFLPKTGTGWCGLCLLVAIIGLVANQATGRSDLEIVRTVETDEIANISTPELPVVNKTTDDWHPEILDPDPSVEESLNASFPFWHPTERP